VGSKSKRIGTQSKYILNLAPILQPKFTPL